MQLTILGCSGSVVSSASPASCYLVQTADQRPIVMDMGNGAMGALQEVTSPSDCDILLSHLHPDHSADLTSLIVWRRYSHEPATSVARLYAPTECARRVGKWFADEAGDCEDLTDTFDHIPWVPGETYDLNGFTIQAFPADHPGESYCLRLTEQSTGRVLAYSGDTADCEGVRAAADQADVFLCEATWETVPNSLYPPHMHLTGTETGRLATECGVGELIVTHIPPWTRATVILDEVHSAYTGQVHLAHPRHCYQWSHRESLATHECSNTFCSTD